MNSTASSKVFPDMNSNEVTVIGFNRRLIAAIYDGFIVAFLTFILVFVLGFVALFIGMFSPSNDTHIQTLMVISALLASFLYFILSWGRSGQTIGMAISGIKVVRTDGAPLGYGKAILRYIGFIISAVIFSLGFLWIGFDKRRQGWHDKIAGTLVTLVDDKFAGNNATFVPSDSGKSKWVWVGVWLIFALIAPGALIGGALWMLGPVVGRAFGAFGG